MLTELYNAPSPCVFLRNSVRRKRDLAVTDSKRKILFVEFNVRKIYRISWYGFRNPRNSNSPFWLWDSNGLFKEYEDLLDIVKRAACRQLFKC